MRIAKPLNRDPPQAGSHGLAYQQSATEDGDSDCDTRHDGQISPPVVNQAAADKSGKSHC
jgi:hypothetical protein